MSEYAAGPSVSTGQVFHVRPASSLRRNVSRSRRRDAGLQKYILRAAPQELIDKLRCRNGNLEITVSKQETFSNEL